MTLKTYLFSQNSNQYQQYTTDQSEEFLRQVCKNCHATHQIAIHREGNLMYYAFAHRKSETEIYGICCVCGEICLNLKSFYDYLQQTLEETARKGVVFAYNQAGEIGVNLPLLSSEPAEIDQLFRELKAHVNRKMSAWENLPPEDFSIPKNSHITLAFNEDNQSRITDALRHYPYVTVTMDYTSPSSVTRMIKGLQTEKATLQGELNTLEQENDSLKKQKKQYKWVIILSTLVFLGMLAIFYFNKNVNDLQQHITEKNLLIDSLTYLNTLNDSIIASQKTRITNMNYELTDSKRLINNLACHIPMIAAELDVKNGDDNYGETIYSHESTYIYSRLMVYGLRDGSVDLYTKFYMPNKVLTTYNQSPHGYSFKDNVSISKNEKTSVYLSGWGSSTKGHWRKGIYRIEVWYQDVCLKSKTFEIY